MSSVAPMNAAFDTTNLVALLSSIPAGSIANVLGAHVVNGSVVYSNEMTTGTGIVPLGGAPVSFISNATGKYIVGEFSTVKILIPDVPIACVDSAIGASDLADPASCMSSRA